MPDDAVVPDSGEWQQAVRTQYDPDCDDELGTKIVYAVADAKAVDPLDQLPVLHDVVDAEYLEESFLASGTVPAVASDSGGHVTFEYAGVLVAVESDGWITVYQPR